MDWFSELIERSEFWSILYILLGFLLGQFALVFREWFNNGRLERALKDELEANLHMIDMKQNIVDKMIRALKDRRVLTGESVPTSSVVYDHHYPAVIKRLSPIQRDNVRYIYSNLRELDSYLENFEDRFKSDVTRVENAYATYQGRLEEIREVYGVTKGLISAYLDGHPKDIYDRFGHQPAKKKLYAGPLRSEDVDRLRG